MAGVPAPRRQRSRRRQQRSCRQLRRRRFRRRFLRSHCIYKLGGFWSHRGATTNARRAPQTPLRVAARHGFAVAPSVVLLRSAGLPNQSHSLTPPSALPQRVEKDKGRGDGGKDFGPREVPRGPPPTLAAPVRLRRSTTALTPAQPPQHAFPPASHLSLCPARTAGVPGGVGVPRRHAPQARRAPRRQHARPHHHDDRHLPGAPQASGSPPADSCHAPRIARALLRLGARPVPFSSTKCPTRSTALRGPYRPNRCRHAPQVVIVEGETGSGKTTQVPQFILEDAAESGSHCHIICTQPRRLSAIGVAERVANERTERLGSTVGYRIRLEARGRSTPPAPRWPAGAPASGPRAPPRGKREIAGPEPRATADSRDLHVAPAFFPSPPGGCQLCDEAHVLHDGHPAEAFGVRQDPGGGERLPPRPAAPAANSARAPHPPGGAPATSPNPPTLPLPSADALPPRLSPPLPQVTHVIIDEVHERSLESDFLLMVIRDLIRGGSRIRVVLMSATVNAALFSDYFSRNERGERATHVPVVSIPGRTFPVTALFLEDALEITGHRVRPQGAVGRGHRRAEWF